MANEQIVLDAIIAINLAVSFGNTDGRQNTAHIIPMLKIINVYCKLNLNPFFLFNQLYKINVNGTGPKAATLHNITFIPLNPTVPL